MNDRQHVRRGEDANEQQPFAPRRERRESRETASILNLQGSAGNRAVAQLLEVQRQPSGAEPTDSRTSGVGTMAIPDMELVTPILAFSQQVGRPNQPKTESGEVVVTIALDSLNPGLQEAVAKGRHFDTITVAIGSKGTFTLHSVVFSSFQVSSDTATLSLNFTSMEFSPGG